jgi:hypothetical protein
MEDIVFQASLTSDNIVFPKPLAGKRPEIDPNFSLTAAWEKVFIFLQRPLPNDGIEAL